MKLNVPGRVWAVIAKAAPRFVETHETGLGKGFLVAGLLITGILAAWLNARERAARQLRDLNENLEQRVAERTAELDQANQALKQYADELLRSNESLQQFAYVASHDLQEPLRAVQGYAQIIASHYKETLDDQGQRYVTNIVEGVDRMKTLIAGLLAYSRVGAHGRPFEKAQSTQMVNDALSNLEAAVEESGAEITMNGMPMIRCDIAQMTQLFQNLISNAIKFHGDSSPGIEIGAVRIDDDWRKENEGTSSISDQPESNDAQVNRKTVRTEDLPDGWLFHVKDNALGIDPQFFDQFFDIFKRLHTRRHRPRHVPENRRKARGPDLARIRARPGLNLFLQHP